MKKVYLAVFVIFIISVFLFVASLFYLDKEKHKLYRYVVNSLGHDVQTIKIDKYITDDRLIYKSQSSSPFDPLWTDSKSRITLDRQYGLVNYFRENFNGPLEDTLYLENTNNNISYMATSRSEFTYLTDIPVKPGALIFEEYSPVTYLPILENYDFSMGKSQAFNVVTPLPGLLPPMKRLLTLTSIRDEYIKVGLKKIKVECLLIKIRNSPQGMLWVTKSGKSLVGIEFPDKKLKIMRLFFSRALEAKKFLRTSETYNEEEVKFNDKKIALAGTLTLPKNGGLHPAILLMGGDQSADREENGLFTDIADCLGKQGFMVLRFDKRGMGLSGGDSRSTTDTDEYEDAASALDYLLSRKDIDPQRIAVIGHGKGSFFAAKLVSGRKDVRALVIMAPLISLGGETDLNFDNLKEMATKLGWGDQYLKLVIKSRMETIDRVKKTKNNWVSLLRTRCFLKKLKEEIEEKPTDIIRKVEAPVLILYGKEDELIPAKAAAMLDKALEESGNKNHKLIYYSYLGHFFGTLTNDGVNKAHYEADKAVLDTLGKWLNDNVVEIPRNETTVAS